MKVIAIAAQKGGVGKSSSADALAAGLMSRGYKVLMVDMDAQCNISESYEAMTRGGTVLSLLSKEAADTTSVIQSTARGDIIAGTESLSGADSLMNDIVGREYVLREALEQLQDKYDYVIIDCPPALGILSVSALVAADEVIIPSTADIYSLKGIRKLNKLCLEPIKKHFNKGLNITGILLTKYNNRALISREVKEAIDEQAAQMGTRVFSATIREGVAVKEAQAMSQSLREYAPRAKVTEDYERFIEEYLREGNNNG